MIDCNEKTPCLGIDGIKMRDEHITMQAFFYLSHIRAFEKQLDCLTQICQCRFNRVALAGDIKFRTQGNIAITFFLKHGGK